MSEFSSIDDIDLDELYPTGETTPPTKKQEFVRPEPVSPAPPPSAGSGSDLLPETDGTTKGVSSPESYYGETYKDLGITLPDNLLEDLGGQDAVAPQTEIEKGMVLPTLFTEGQWGYSGEFAFDIAAMRDKAADARTARWTRQFLKDNDRAPTQEESSQKYIEFAAEANDEIYDLANKVRGARASALPGSQGVPRRFLWLDIDPGGKLYSTGLFGISAAKQEERDFISKIAAPFIVSMAGVEQNLLAEDIDEEGRIGQKMVKTPYNESHALGFLDWIGRQSLLSYAATAAVAGSSEDQDSWAAGRTPWALINPVNYYRGWGSNKQLELLSRGEDIVSLADELQLRNMTGAKYLLDGAEALGIISPETSEKGQQLSEFATAFGLALVDPDVFSIMTLGAGKIAKIKTVTKVGDILGTSTTAKTAARQQAAEAASKNLADLAVSQESDSFEVGSKIDQILNTLDPEQKQIALTQARIMVASDPKASKLTEALANRVIVAKRIQNPPQKIAQQAGIRGRLSTEASGEMAARVERGEAPPSSKFKREAFKEGDNLDAYKQAQLEDMWAASALADAETQKRIVTNLRSGTRASRATKAAVSYDQLKAVSEEVQTARKEMKEAFLETSKPRGTGKYDESKQTAKYAKAKKRQELAVARFNELALQMATNTADDAEMVLDQLIATAKLQKQQSAAKLQNITNTINKKGDFKVDPKEHQYVVNSIVKRAPKALEQRALISALSVALGEQAAAYGKLNKFVQETKGAGSAIGGVSRAAELYKKSAEAAGKLPLDDAARRADDLYTLEQVELTTGWFSKGNKEGNFVRSLNFMGEGLKNFWNPAQKVLGPASEEVHQIGISSLGMIRKVHSDMVRKLQPAVKQAGDEAEALAIEQKLSRNEIRAARVKAESLTVKAYFTSTESINGSFMNTIFDGRSLWDMAKPMLRSTTGASNQEDSSMAFNALYKMWLPPGEDLTLGVRAGLEETGRNLLKYGQATKPKNFKKADAATKEKYKQAADNLSFDEFSEGMREATNSLFKGQGKVDPNAVRVNYFALEAVSQMAIMNMASTRMNKVLADFPQESIEAAVRLASGDSLNPGQDFVEATKVLNKLKVPGPLRLLGTAGNKQIEVGLRMYSDGYGNKAFVPYQWMKQTSELLSKIEKTAEAYGTKVLDPWEQQAISTYQGIYRLWHSAILTGLFIPRAAYFTNIYVGNFGQLLARQGFMAAARYTKDSAKDILVWTPQELARQTPLGKYVDAAAAKMDAKLGTDFHLASPTNAIINRHIAMVMDPSIADNATKIKGKTGVTFTMGELRRFAVEQGVFTSFADSAGLSNLLSRTNPGFGKKFWGQIKQGGPLAKRYADFADTLEQRQRVGLFTDLVVNRGMSPEEAGKVVRDALYDWDSPMTGLETAFAKNVFMFYNFTRRAMGQGMRILLDPYLSATTDTAAEGVLRSSPFLSMLTGKPAYQSANVMAMERTRRELSEYMADEDTAAEYPWWAKKAHNKMFLPNSPMGQERASSYSQTLGKDVNYKVTTVPSLTPIEMVNQWGDMARILGAYGVSWAVDTPMNIIYPEGARPSTVTFKDDVLVPMMGKVAEQAGPFGEEAVQGIMDSIANDKQSYISGGVNVNRLSDRKILEWLEQMGPFMSGIAWEDAKNPGKVRTSASTYALLKALPTISNDVNTLIGPYLDVSAEGGEVSEALLETLTSYAGFKTYRYNPQEVRDWDAKTIRDKMSAMVREENRKIPLGSTKPEVTPAQKANLLEEDEFSEFSSIDDIVIE